MKEMIYKDKKEFEILDMGRIFDYEYYIISFGIHPVAYVDIPKDHPAYGKEYEYLDIDVHGGLTFSSDKLFLQDRFISGSFIGWDYAHFTDFTGNELLYPVELMTFGKKWHTIEIRYEVLKVCEQLEYMRLNKFYNFGV